MTIKPSIKPNVRIRSNLVIFRLIWPLFLNTKFGFSQKTKSMYELIDKHHKNLINNKANSIVKKKKKKIVTDTFVPFVTNAFVTTNITCHKFLTSALEDKKNSEFFSLPLKLPCVRCFITYL